MSRDKNEWRTATLGEFLRGKGKSLNPKKFKDETFELFSVPSHLDKKPEILIGAEIGSSKQCVEPNQVLLSKINPRINRVWKVSLKEKFRQIASSEWIVFDENEEICPEFLVYFLNQGNFKNFLCMNVSGVGGSLMRVKPSIVAPYPIHLPPLAEQERIVDKIDELFSSIEAGERAIEQARAGVARYRKAILKAAVTGELTADWRIENPPKESAKDLLARILTARYEAWVESELTKLDAKGKARPETEKQWEKFRARYKPPVEPDLEKLPQLPDSWVWVLSDAVTQVTKLAGFEFTDFVNYVEDGDLPVVKAGNVAQNDYNSSEMAKVKSDEVSHLKRSELFGGEILMAFVGANLGKVSILPSTEKFFLGPNVAVIRPQAEFLSSQFGATFYQSDFGFTRLRNSSVGAAQGSISMGRIRNAAIPIMGQEEQAEIVDRVEQALSKADAVEATLDAQSHAAKALKQAVLKTAFEGKLVPQNPKDEPASELLKRIKEET